MLTPMREVDSAFISFGYRPNRSMVFDAIPLGPVAQSYFSMNVCARAWEYCPCNSQSGTLPAPPACGIVDALDHSTGAFFHGGLDGPRRLTTTTSQARPSLSILRASSAVSSGRLELRHGQEPWFASLVIAGGGSYALTGGTHDVMRMLDLSIGAKAGVSLLPVFQPHVLR